MTRDDVHLTPTSYLRRLRHEGKRLPYDERSELVTGMQAHVADLESQALAPDVLAARLAALGDPQRIVDDYLAMTGGVRPYRTKVVIAALICAWAVSLSSLVYLWVDSFFSMGINESMIILGISGVIRSVGALALLVTTIVGSMWRRWLDGITALLLLLSANSIPVLVAMNSTVVSPRSFAVVAGIALTVAILILAACTAHWAVRLGRQLDRMRTAATTLGGGAIVAGLVVGGVAIAHAAGVTSGAGQLTVVNDTGAAATVTFCPRQNCSSATGITINNGDHRSFNPTNGNMPDSVVVKQQGQPTKCALDMGGIGLPGENAGEVMYLSREADTETCGADVESMNGGPAPGIFSMPGMPPGHSATATPVGTSIIYLSMLAGPGCMSGAAGEVTLRGRAAGDLCNTGAVFDQFGTVVGQDTSEPTSDTRVTAKLHATQASRSVPVGWSTWDLTMRHTPDGWRIAAIARRP